MKRLGADRYAKAKWKGTGLVAFAADREATGRPWKPGDQTQTVRMTTADTDIAEALGLEVGDQVYEQARLVKEANVPTHTLTSYYRPADVEGTPLVDAKAGPAGRGGGFAVLTSQGLEPDNMTETIRARMPTPDEIDQLQLPGGEPVMILQRITYTAEGRITTGASNLAQHATNCRLNLFWIKAPRGRGAGWRARPAGGRHRPGTPAAKFGTSSRLRLRSSGDGSVVPRRQAV